MTIYSIAFNKRDFRYSIGYKSGSDNLTLDTNEEALSSMEVAIQTLAQSLKNYCNIDDGYEVSIDKVNFGVGHKPFSVVFTARSTSKAIYPQKIVHMAMNIRQSDHWEKEIAEDRASVLINIGELLGEVGRYLNGERNQQKLDFREDQEEETELIDDIDLFNDD